MMVALFRPYRLRSRALGLLALGLLGLLSCKAGPPAQEIGFTPDWTVSGGNSLQCVDGVLEVSYRDAQRKPFLIAPRSPIPLPDSIQYLTAWVARIEGDFTLSLVIGDANGGSHVLPVRTSRPGGAAVGWQQARCRQWSMWHQIISYNLSTPSAPEERFGPARIDAVSALIWPRPLTLTGIQVQPATRAGWDVPHATASVQKGQGKLALSDLRLVTQPDFDADWSWHFVGRLCQGSDMPPVLFPDDLSESSGLVRYDLELHKGYQGPVIWQEQGVKMIDRNNPGELFTNRIALPTLPTGRYFLSAKTWKPDGTLDAERLMLELDVLRSNAPPADRNESTAFHWESDQPHHVFPSGTQTAVLRMVTSPEQLKALPGDKVFHVRVIDYNNRPVVEKTYPAAEATSVEIPVEPSGEYFAVAELQEAGGKVYDRAHLHLGVATSPAEVAQRQVPDEVPTRDEYLNGKVHYTAEYWIGCRSGAYPWVNPIDPAAFDQWIQQAVRAGATSICVGDVWGNHEMLPGVMQWSEMDREINLARQHGLKVFLAYTADGASRRQLFPPWLEADPQVDQYGRVPFGEFRPSYWDPAVRQGWQAYFAKLAGHVVDNPTVVGYRLENYALMGKTLGWGVDSYRIDYSPAAQQAFDQWQAERGRAPHPLTRPFLLPGVLDQKLPGPDLSPGFREFMDFNNHTMMTRTREIFDAIRSVDPKRQIQLDQKPFSYAVEEAIPILRDGGALKNEDSPNFRVAALRSMAVQNGVPYVEELHNHMPTSRSIADATNFWSSYLSQGIFWLMRWSNVMIVEKPAVAHAGQHTDAWLLDYMKESTPHWEEWVQARQPEPQVLVFGSRAQGLLGDSRTGGDLEIAGIHVFDTLFEAHQVPCHFADEYTDWVDLSRFKVVFVAGEAMPEHAIDRLVAHARDGGKIVLVGRAGRYCPEQPAERDLLRKRLMPYSTVKSIPEPTRMPIPDQPAWVTRSSFPTRDLEDLLAWAGVQRDITASGETQTPGFECQLRTSEDNKTRYAAVMRKWNGWYPSNIEREGALEKKYGRASCRVTIPGLDDGLWKVQQFHRDAKELGSFKAADGQLSFETPPLLAGEVQLYRIVPATP